MGFQHPRFNFAVVPAQQVKGRTVQCFSAVPTPAHDHDGESWYTQRLLIDQNLFSVLI